MATAKNLDEERREVERAWRSLSRSKTVNICTLDQFNRSLETIVVPFDVIREPLRAFVDSKLRRLAEEISALGVKPADIKIAGETDWPPTHRMKPLPKASKRPPLKKR